jgi:hypothetical protein
MDITKLSRNDWIVIGGMGLLFIALFLPWYSFSVLSDLAKAVGVSASTSVNGWHFGLGWLAWLLSLVAAAAVSLKAIPSASSVKLPFPEALVAMVLGVVAFVFVLIRVISAPTLFSRSWGLFIGLIAAALVGFGGFLKNSES